ncbi:MAG: hypothetical protein ABII90_05525 [Bacteroidota bacterium]
MINKSSTLTVKYLNRQLIMLVIWLTIMLIAANSSIAQVPDSQPYLLDADSSGYHAIIFWVDDIDWCFYRAKNHYINMNEKLAAFEIRKAISYIKIEAANTTGKEKDQINQSVRELESTAKRLDEGKPIFLYDMNIVFANAHFTLAAYQHKISAEYWKAEKPVKTGISLDAASRHLAYAASWSGQKIGIGVKETWKWTRTVTSALLKGVGFVPEQVGKALKFIGTETKNLGDKVKPHP